MPVQSRTILSGYERLDGPVPVVYAPGLEERATEVHPTLEMGAETLSALLGVESREIEAILIAEEDWDAAPHENAYVYPPGLPYFTRSVRPPTLVLPATLSPVFKPRTEATYPLTVWHELAHAFLLQDDVVRTPAWLREFVPQASSAAIARKAGLPLHKHLRRIDREPGFTIRSLKGHVSPEEQMAFQNLLLLLGAATVEEFGDRFLKRLAHALWEETEIVDEERAEELLASAVGPGGQEWLRSRPEF